MIEKIKYVCDKLMEVSIKYKTPKPFIVGGMVRDYILKSKESKDFDITTNSSHSSFFLGILFSDYYGRVFSINKNNNSLSVYFDGSKIDFSSGYRSERVIEDLKDVNDELYEVYSRDFTIDTIHMSCDTLKIFDYSGKGIDDLNKKIIRTVSHPEITLTDDPKRIFRSIYLASRYNFSISEDIIQYVYENSNIIDDIIKTNSNYITNIIDDSLKYNEEISFKYLKDMNISNKIPLFANYSKLLLEKGLFNEYLKNTNNY